ncbi:MAG: hypothetical protein ACJ72Y_01890 [Actinomycetes bacterium]
MIRRAVIAGALAVGLAIPMATPAITAIAAPSASPLLAQFEHRAGTQPTSLPPGWSADVRGTTTQLTWQSSDEVPLADAPLEFWLGHQLLGTPKPGADGRSFTLDIDSALSGSLQGLRVTIGGLPVNAAGQPRPIPTPEAPASGPAPTGVAETQPSTIDPGLPGRFATKTSEYSLPGVKLTGLPKDVEVQGVVVRPTDAPGPRPLVLFLHGRHGTCYRGGPDGRASGAWPCPTNWQPIPSYRGYLDAQQLLASQGYVTVSISANGINGQDYRTIDGGAQARSELVRHHLALFHAWNTVGGAPFGSTLVGRVDLDRVMLVGHSRGGEGVNRAAIDSTTSDPWRIDSQVLIGPTAFGRQTAPGVDTEVLLPFCDGDVSDLQGQQYIDQARDLFGTTPDPALRSAVLVMGANHNFFNKEWTPGDAVAPAFDDWGGRTGYCGKRSDTRLSAADQRNVGAVYIATAARAFIKNDPDALELIDGSDLRPPSIGDAAVQVAALGANRTRLLTFQAHTEIHSVDALALVCRGYRTSKDQPTCAPGVSKWSQPHFLQMYGASEAPPSSALRMRWQQPGAHVTVPLPSPVDLTASSSLDLRVAVRPESGKAAFDVVVGDGSGHVAHLGSQTLYALPGDHGLSRLWAQAIRLPLPDQSAMDFSDVEWIRFVGDSRDGRVVVLDAYGRAPGVSDAARPTLPRVDVQDVTITEGDGGQHFEEITLDITGHPVGGERFYVDASSDGRGGDSVKSVFRVRPGQTTVTVPFPVSGDKRDDYRIRSSLTVKALTGIITGDYSGFVTTRDDDPAPNAVIDAPVQVTTEGSALHWVVQLDHRSDKSIGWQVKPVVAGDNELTVGDLPDRYRRHHNLGSYPDDTKLSETRLHMSAYLRPGRLATEFVLPIKVDEVSELPETVTLRQVRPSESPLPSDLFGTVTDVATRLGQPR